MLGVGASTFPDDQEWSLLLYDNNRLIVIPQEMKNLALSFETLSARNLCQEPYGERLLSRADNYSQ